MRWLRSRETPIGEPSEGQPSDEVFLAEIARKAAAGHDPTLLYCVVDNCVADGNADVLDEAKRLLACDQDGLEKLRYAVESVARTTVVAGEDGSPTRAALFAALAVLMPAAGEPPTAAWDPSLLDAVFQAIRKSHLIEPDHKVVLSAKAVGPSLVRVRPDQAREILLALAAGKEWEAPEADLPIGMGHGAEGQAMLLRFVVGFVGLCWGSTEPAMSAPTRAHADH